MSDYIDELMALLDEYDVPPGDLDERLVLVLRFWQEQHREEPEA